MPDPPFSKDFMASLSPRITFAKGSGKTAVFAGEDIEFVWSTLVGDQGLEEALVSADLLGKSPRLSNRAAAAYWEYLGEKERELEAEVGVAGPLALLDGRRDSEPVASAQVALSM